MDNQKTAIVIGAGIGGLTAGHALSKLGYNVNVFEKSKIPGGSFTSYEKQQYTIDTGFHFLTNPKGCTFHKYINEFVRPENIPELLDFGGYHILMDGKLERLPQSGAGLLKFGILPVKGRIEFTKFFLALGKEYKKGIESLKDREVEPFVRKYIKDKTTLRFVNGLTWMTSGYGIDRASFVRFAEGFVGGEAVHEPLLSKLMPKKPNLDQYPIGGLRAIPEMLITDGMLNVHCQEQVSKIFVKGKKVGGVLTSEGQYDADVVVYAGAPADLGRLIGKEMPAPEPYYAGYLTVGLTEKRLDLQRKAPLWFSPVDEEPYGSPYGGMCSTDFDSSLAPDGHQLFSVSTIIDDINKQKDQEEVAREVAEKLCPDYENHADLVEWHVVIAEGARQMTERSYRDLPDQKTSMENFFLAGTGTKGRGSGATIAAEAAYRLRKYIEEQEAQI